MSLRRLAAGFFAKRGAKRASPVFNNNPIILKNQI